ncbi:D-3-phosphoglycerate dehydrogenase / 2-oxoglutarate reductase [termite gut metagenome]|uniref:D-3-phosphoglycerate dehydrogenase / 2-oxoglutarate reductase n=1 Tax=termite gut metagenome TaxID=433724 RepID=A0A5J4QRE3_9ZZZZ
MKIVILDSNLGSIDLERNVSEPYGIQIDLPKQCKTEEDVFTVAKGADALVVQYAPVTRKIIEALPHLKVVSEYGVGVDSIDLAACTEKGIAVCNVPDYSYQEVSDQAIALTMALDRGIVVLDKQIRSGHYGLAAVKPLHRISGRIFGVIGLGRIARATALKARGIGYKVIGTDVALEPGTTTDEGIPIMTFDEVLSQSDVVSLHVPLMAKTKHLINAAALSKMKPDAILINTARGGIVDTEALLAVLKNKTIRGAGLDVFETEPLPEDHPLTALDNVILTPHAGYYSEESLFELKTRPVQNAVDVLTGKKPRNILNPQVLT